MIASETLPRWDLSNVYPGLESAELAQILIAETCQRENIAPDQWTIHADRGGPFTLSQLKIIQEAITLTVFLLFAVLVAKESPRPRDLIAMALVLAAVWVAVSGRN